MMNNSQTEIQTERKIEENQEQLRQIVRLKQGKIKNSFKVSKDSESTKVETLQKRPRGISKDEETQRMLANDLD